jgi:hypothetical protein
MKDITSTSFGLLIAYFLPGLTGLYTLTFYMPRLNQVLQKFLESKADIGLILLTVAVALTLGIILNIFRTIIFEMLPPLGFRGLSAKDYNKLTDAANLNSYLLFVEENYRFHQFSGSIAITLSFIYYAWLRKHWTTARASDHLWAFVAYSLIQIATVVVAQKARRRFVERGKHILQGS